MKWFYNLKRSVRIIIAVASWLPLVIFACAIAGSIGENGENMQGWQAAVTLALLAVGIFFTVFAVIAGKREKSATRAAEVPPARTATQPAAAPVRPVATAIRPAKPSFNDISDNRIKTVSDDTAVFCDTPEFTVKLSRNGKAEYQDNITSCKIGDNVLLERDEAGILCFSSGGEIGYLPDHAIEMRRGKYLIKIEDIPYNENTDKYAVVIAAYPLKAGGASVTFPVHTKIRGVTFEGRQVYLSESRAGDVLTVRHAPTKEYPNTIAVINTRTGKTLGNIGSDLAESLIGAYGAGCAFNAEILEITGGADGAKYGCNIVIDGMA